MHFGKYFPRGINLQDGVFMVMKEQQTGFSSFLDTSQCIVYSLVFYCSFLMLHRDCFRKLLPLIHCESSSTHSALPVSLSVRYGSVPLLPGKYFTHPNRWDERARQQHPASVELNGPPTQNQDRFHTGRSAQFPPD